MSTKKLDAIRAKIAALVDQRDEIADAPLDRAEIGDHIDAVLKVVVSHPITGPSPPGLRNASFSTTDLEKLLTRPGLLVELLREPLKAYLLGVFDAEAAGATGLPAVERRKKLTELDAQIYKLEQEEEHTIELLEEQGHDIVRRVAADPRAALGIGASEAA